MLHFNISTNASVIQLKVAAPSGRFGALRPDVIDGRVESNAADAGPSGPVAVLLIRL